MKHLLVELQVFLRVNKKYKTNEKSLVAFVIEVTRKIKVKYYEKILLVEFTHKIRAKKLSLDWLLVMSFSTLTDF